MRRLLVGTMAVVGLVMPCVGAVAAQAAPLSMSFNDSRANVGVQLDDTPLFVSPDDAALSAQIDDSGAITGGTLDVPDFSTLIDDPIDANVTVQFDIGQVTGSYNPVGGVVSLSGTAGGTLHANGHQCTVATVPSVLTLTSTGTSGGTNPRKGARFTSGPAGPGAVAGQWTDMTATAPAGSDANEVSWCNAVDERIGGPGGVWMHQGQPGDLGDPLAMAFTGSHANVGVQLDDEPLFESPDSAVLGARIQPGSDWITSGTLSVPDFNTFITQPLNANVNVDFDIGPVTGDFNPATGALVLAGTAGGTLTSGGSHCTVATVPPVLSLSTAGSSGGSNPRSGSAFDDGLDGDGAIAGQWTDMTATPVTPGDATVCNTVDERIGGPGGIWIEQSGLDPFSMSFTDSSANVGVQLADTALFEAPATASLSGLMDSDTGHIAAASLDVPDFMTHITDPVDSDVNVAFDIGAITGDFDDATGALSLTGRAAGILTAGENNRNCNVAVPGTLTLTTSGNNGTTATGSPFTHGLDGDGAIAGEWSDMDATPVTPADTTMCSTVDERIGGPGGIWMEQDAPAPAAPVCAATSAQAAYQTAVELTLGCSGEDRDIAIVAGPAHGSLGAVDQATGKVTYTPAAGFVGDDSFTFKAENEGGASQTVTASIAVGPKPPEPPKPLGPAKEGKSGTAGQPKHTGKRAAAQRKCRKAKVKKARRKCAKRAARLPV